eukprot:jgi/Picsp_1/1483/NSC_04961-R1_protein
MEPIEVLQTKVEKKCRFSFSPAFKAGPSNVDAASKEIGLISQYFTTFYVPELRPGDTKKRLQAHCGLTCTREQVNSGKELKRFNFLFASASNIVHSNENSIEWSAPGGTGDVRDSKLVKLPVTDSSGTVDFVWDGSKVVAIEKEREQSVKRSSRCGAKFDAQNVMDKKVLDVIRWKTVRCIHGVRCAFFPSQNDVTPDYWEYVKWRAWHRLFSSMSSIFSTQSLLLAIGIGAKKSLPSAAAINWVLKDGLGRLGRLTVATKFGESFDADLKRFRFSSSLLYAGALSLDYLTPLAPAHFLPMAALANVGKSVGLTTYIATQPAFHKSFAKSENIADISAKAQAQQMAVDTVGLGIAVSLNMLLRNKEAIRKRLPLALFPFLVSADLYSIYNELRSIHIRTLNKERAELLAQHWVCEQKILSPMEVCQREHFILPPVASTGPYPLHIGPLRNCIQNEEDLDGFIKSFRSNEKYFASVNSASDTRKGSVEACFRKDASTDDILEVVLLSAYLRNSSAKSQPQFRKYQHLSKLERQSKRNVRRFMADLRHAGWQIDSVTLNKVERQFYK